MNLFFLKDWLASKVLPRTTLSLRSLAASSKLASILRVNQLDALRLDNEANEILYSQFMATFQFFQADIIEKFKPELISLLDMLIFYFSILSTDTTFGNQLQNLKFVNSNFLPLSMKRKVLYGILLISGRWLWSRMHLYLSASRLMMENPIYLRLWNLMNRIETTFRFLSILNFLVFLYNGKYVSLVNRLLSIRLSYLTTNGHRQLNFEYMNRQLVWFEFTEFLMFVIPLVNIDKLKNILVRSFYSPSHPSSIPEDACPVCRHVPVETAYLALPCRHRFCYYCLKQSCMIDSGFTCTRCGTVITEISRVQASS